MVFAFRRIFYTACLFLCLAQSVSAAVVNAIWNTAADVPVSASSYTATGSTVNFILNCAPPTGTNLTVVNNTGLPFTSGTFDNLAQGQAVNLSYNGSTYSFVANYYGGTGNDLVLVWASNRPLSWGLDSYGQLGNNMATTTPTPVAAATSGLLAGKTVTAISCGASHTLALCSDGTVAAWGDNTYGQLGNGASTSSNQPVAVTTAGTALAGKTVIAVAAGSSHSLALCSDGTVASWGYNSNGQLGNGSTTSSNVPVAVSTATVLSGKTVKSFAAGNNHSLAVCSDGTVAAWGSNSSGQLGNNSTTQSIFPTAVITTGVLSGKTVKSVSAGFGHSLALCSDGTVAAWGLNLNGQLGNNSTAQSNVPVAVTTSGVLSGKTVNSIAAGYSHSLALCSDGTAAAWGINANGPLGNNSTTQSNVPVAVNTSGVLAGKTIIAITAGNNDSLALCSDGTLAAWGYNGYCQLSSSSSLTQSTVPVLVSTSGNALQGKTVSAFSAGQFHCAAVCSDGTVAMWGSNSSGQLGNGATYSFPVPMAVTTNGTLISGKTLLKVATGGSHSLALCSDGTLATWGLNAYGQLGNNSTSQSTVPVAVSTSGALAGKTVIALAAGNYHSLALCSDGTVVTWGFNSNGQLGNGSTTQSTVPVAVSTSGVLSGKTVIAVAAGTSHSLALCTDGTVAAWGYNAYGQLGNNSTTQSTVPVAVNTSGVLAGKTVISLSAGGYQSLALCSDGTVAAWGNNSNGQLGNNSTTNSSVPVAVSTSGVLSGKTVTAVSAGYYHSLALCSDGTVLAWGYGGSGQLGNNGTTSIPVPVAVDTSGILSGRTVMAISAGYYHNLALCTDGTLVSWGYGPNGELGSGSTQSLVPAAVSTNALSVGEQIAGTSTAAFAQHGMAIVAGPSRSASIYVKQSTGPRLYSGSSSVDCGSSALGEGVTQTLTVGNAGQADLSITNVTIDGVNAADFAITTAPASTVAAGGTTTLVVTFSPGAAFGRNSALHITSNDPFTSTFSVALTGSGTAVLVAGYQSAADVPVTTRSLNATGSTVNFSLNYAPVPGTTLTVVNNTGPGFISGAFGNLAQGQVVNLSYGGVSYPFVASYYGGTGNDLVLMWANTRPVAWGSNITGMLGQEKITPEAVTTAGTPLVSRTLLAYSGGYYHSMAVCADGSLVSWGDNSEGQLGNGTTSNSSVPLAVPTAGTPLQGRSVVAVSAGYFNNVALCSDGTLATWGTDAYTGSQSPVAVTTAGTPLEGRSVVAVGTGGYHYLALCSDGTLAAWGLNYIGELGNGSTTNSSVPLAVITAGTPLAGKTVVSIAVGADHNLVLCSDGTLAAWGKNLNGQLGNGTTTNSNLPVAVTTTGTPLEGKTVVAVAAGGYHSLALCSDGTLVGWGSCYSGQQGNNSSVPVAVTTAGTPLEGKTVAGINAGYYHNLALCTDGTLVSWGQNNNEQLGNNSNTSSSIPVAVDTSSLAPTERYVLAAAGVCAIHNLALVASPVSASATLAASTISATTVMLNGTVNANGGTAAVSFDYGLDSTYGTNVAGTPASATDYTDTAVSTTLTGLLPGTTYHFRANGGNGAGTANGADLTFTTLSLLQNWRQTFFGTTASSGSTADTADYDGDGIPNLMEYALNLSPTTPSKLPVTTALNGANFEYTYSRSTSAAGAGTTYGVQWSSALPGTWSSSGVTQTVLSDDGTTQQVKAVIPVNAANAMFVRLSVTAPP